MSKAYKPREHPRFKEFKKKNVTREDVKAMLQAYDDLRVASLDARIARLEAPWWRRLWWRVIAWWRRPVRLRWRDRYDEAPEPKGEAHG